jgi:dolichol-phosphate mannosyltransferase
MQQSLLTGVKLASGACVTVLQADLQDPPQLIVEMARRWKSGQTYVATQMAERQEQLLHRIGAWFFYRGLQFVSGQKVRANSTDFYLFDRSLIPELVYVSGSTPFIRTTLASIAQPDSILRYRRGDRDLGQKMSIRGRVDFAFDAFLINLGGIARKMALLAFGMGILIALAAGLLLVSFIIGYRSPVAGWMTSTLLFFVLISGGLFLGSLQLTFLYRLNRDMPRKNWALESEIVRRTSRV